MIANILFFCAFVLGGLALIGLAFIHPTIAHSVRKCSLIAAWLSAAVCTYAFVRRVPVVVVKTVEVPAVVERVEPTPEEAMRIIVRDRVRSALTEQQDGL